MGTKAKVLVGVATVTLDIGLGSELVVGYTADGVDMAFRSDFFDAKVEEIVGTIKRAIIDQTLEVTLNMAEGTLDNMTAAIPSASLAVATITLGGGSLQDTTLTLVGTDPAGAARTITLASVNPVGEVGIPYKKGEISIVPVTFSAVVDDSGNYGTLVDS